MPASFAHPPFMPCPECGASVAVAKEAEHTCDPDRVLDYELFQLREEISELDTQVEEYLSSTQGRFEQWYAEHHRSRLYDDDPPNDPAAEPAA